MGMQMNSWYDIMNMDWKDRSISESDVHKNSEWITSVIDQEIELLDGNSKGLFIGGFSQGGCMAIHSGLAYKDTIGGIVG